MNLISRTTIGIFLVLIAVLISMISLSSYSLGIYSYDRGSPEYLSASTFLTIGITLLLVSVAVLMGLVVLSSGVSLDFHIQGSQYPEQPLAPVLSPVLEMQYREAGIDGSNATLNNEYAVNTTVNNDLSKIIPGSTSREEAKTIVALSEAQLTADKSLLDVIEQSDIVKAIRTGLS